MTDTAPPESQTVSVTIDGTVVEARPGELIIDAAERAGVFIPRFCYHPHMEPVGMCRMCLVEVSGPRGFSLQPACFLPVTEGQEIRTASAPARKAQEGVLEFLLVNHPLDCPVCDKGGECPLQDQALSHGPGESRFIEEKRHWAKPIDISPLVALDRERCIQCARCTRFAEEIAGEALIDFAGRGDQIEVAPFPGRPFSSYFSGNTVQICPVGALTAKPYRFKARPWDLEQVESTCTTCAVGCRVAAQSQAGQLVRFLGVDSLPVNESWLCDKGRFSHETIYSPARLSEPLRRAGEALAPATWHEAMTTATAALRSAMADGPGRIGVIGGARFSNEDAYAWSKLARTVLATDSVDAQLGDGLPAELVLGLPRATIAQATEASLIITLGPDLREELPVLYLRLRAAAKAGHKILECSSVETALSAEATQRLGYLPGEAAVLAEALVTDAARSEVHGIDAGEITAARQLIAEAGSAGSGVVVVLGRPSVAESASTIASAASLLAEALPEARFLIALRRANVNGAIDMGLSPGVLPGRVALEAGRAWFGDSWGALPERRGLDATGILEAAAAGELSALVLLGADPISDFPDTALAERALRGVPHVISLATHHDSSTSLCEVVLPVPADGERAGSTTNLEGRVSTLAAKINPPVLARAPWVVAADLAAHLGRDLGVDSLDSITDEICRDAPAYIGVSAHALRQSARRDGIVVPLSGAVATAPEPIDPIATPGITAVDEQGAPLRVGSAEPLGLAEGPPPGADSRPRPAGIGRPEPSQVVAPRLDAYSHRLVVRRSLYDYGTLVTTSHSLAGLVPDQELLVHPADLARLGVADGDSLRVRASGGEVVAPVRSDETISRGVVALGRNLSADGVNDAGGLIDAASLATDVRLETV